MKINNNKYLQKIKKMSKQNITNLFYCQNFWKCKVKPKINKIFKTIKKIMIIYQYKLMKMHLIQIKKLVYLLTFN